MQSWLDQTGHGIDKERKSVNAPSYYPDEHADPGSTFAAKQHSQELAKSDRLAILTFKAAHEFKFDRNLGFSLRN